MSTNQNQHHAKALFAGHLFTLPPGGEHLLTRDAQTTAGNAFQVTTTLGMPLAGAFLTELRDKSRWLFVAGPGQCFGGPRDAFADESTDRDGNAQALARLGVPILDLEAANENLRGAGQSLKLHQ